MSVSIAQRLQVLRPLILGLIVLGAVGIMAPGSDADGLRGGRALTPADRAYDCGYVDGEQVGWRYGYEDGAHRRRLDDRTPRLSKQGRHYRSGFRAAFPTAYRRGYTAGRRTAGASRGPGRYR